LVAKSKAWRNVDARSAPTAGERPPKANVTTSQKQGLVVEGDNEVPAIANAEGKRAANDLRNSVRLVDADPALYLDGQGFGETSNKIIDAGLIGVHTSTRGVGH